jgi:methyl-accepting chemotaxis protein
MNFNQMKVSSRLSLGFGVVLTLMIVIIAVGLMRMSAINDAMSEVINNRAPKVEAMEDIAFKVMDNTRLVRNVILLTNEKSQATNKAAFEKNASEIKERFAYLDKHIVNPKDVAQLKETEAARSAFLDYSGEVMTLALAGKNDEATKALYGEKYKTQATYIADIRGMIVSQKEHMREAGQRAAESYASARALIIGVGVAAAVLGILLALLITRSISKQLGGEPSTAADLARAVAAGDLSGHIEVKPGDSTSMLAQLKVMQHSLIQVVSDVRSGSESVATASAQIAQGNQDLSSRTEEQASALEETAASMEELSSTVKQNADNAKQANQLALSASTVAIKGGEVVGQVVTTMKGINDSSKKIADIISVIDGIAFQTNILALNAAVEAARAGEQGRGFAVVASEVRSLAGRSADAAKEIKGLITASVERVEQGTALVDQAGSTMTEVVSAIKRVTDIMGEISAASAEQSAGVAQVGEAITQMDQATQQNTALVEESAAAAESLKVQAQQLVGAVAVFKLSGNEQSYAQSYAPAPAAYAPAPSSSYTAERRGPARAKNVTRPNFKGHAATPEPK